METWALRMCLLRTSARRLFEMKTTHIQHTTYFQIINAPREFSGPFSDKVSNGCVPECVVSPLGCTIVGTRCTTRRGVIAAVCASGRRREENDGVPRREMVNLGERTVRPQHPSFATLTLATRILNLSGPSSILKTWPDLC